MPNTILRQGTAGPLFGRHLEAGVNTHTHTYIYIYMNINRSGSPERSRKTGEVVLYVATD